MTYQAFLSYASPDRELAERLHRRLERIGRNHWWNVRARRVFLDRESVAASDNLWGKVEHALRESSHLVLLASPHAAASAWVQREVEWWRQHRGPSALLIALAHGHVFWDGGAGDFTPAFGDKPTNAIPAALRGAFPVEPEWVVVEPSHDSRAVTECAAALVAGIERVDKEHLLKRD